MSQVMSCLKIIFFIEKVNKSFDFDWLKDLCLAAQFVQEGTVGEETIFILNSCQFIEKCGTVILGDFISHKRQESLELSQHHGSILVFVVQFAQLNVVKVVSGVFGLLDGLLDEGDNLVELLVALLGIISLAKLDTGLLGEVHA